MNDLVVRLVLLGQVLSTCYMTGLIWFVQVVHYPLMNVTGTAEFTSYEARHTTLTTWVVGPPMLLEISTAFLLLTYRPTGISSVYAWGGLLLIGVIWISTATLQVPCHQILSNGFNETIHGRLVATNWIRTIAWSLRAALVIAMVWMTWDVRRA